MRWRFSFCSYNSRPDLWDYWAPPPADADGDRPLLDDVRKDLLDFIQRDQGSYDSAHTGTGSGLDRRITKRSRAAITEDETSRIRGETHGGQLNTPATQYLIQTLLDGDEDPIRRGSATIGDADADDADAGPPAKLPRSATPLPGTSRLAHTALPIAHRHMWREVSRKRVEEAFD